MPKLTFAIIEDDSVTADIQKSLLERQGHTVHVNLDALDGVEFVSRVKPDILLIDIMMPGMDGLEVCRRLRQVPELKKLKIIVVSSKSYAADRERALSLGADGMLLKPVTPSSFVTEVLALASDDMDITYWGVRGTLPVPGRKSLRYGGNTSCITLAMPRDQLFILDAGSGIRELSAHMMATRDGKLTAKILITHPHWVHITALPFFVPLYMAGNEFEVMGPAQGARTMREMISAQMDGIYFPITLRELGARIFFRNLAEEEVTFGDVTVRTMLLSHPGNCIGYRITMRGRSFCYITDNELYLKDAPGYQQNYVDKLVQFVGGCDVLLTDTTYTDAQYKSRVNWGHSCVSEVIALAHAAGVKELQLMHHDPDQTDDDIDRKLDDARSGLARMRSSVVCTAPVEGSRKRLGADGQLTELKQVAM
jgi:CheY-like chemotaxis protein/phosphoribosyl 1,2-cyclic phosphodiesterase